MNRETELVRARAYGRIWRIALVIAIAGVLALPGIATHAMAKGGGGKVPPLNPYNPFKVWEMEDDYWMGLYGVKATFDVVNPTYTLSTKSMVGYSVSVQVDESVWLETGYLKGWYPYYGQGGLMWKEAPFPTVYYEIGGIPNIYGAPSLVFVMPAIALPIGSERTWSIYWDWLTGYWELYYEEAHLASVYWESDITADSLTIQGECRDTDDGSNGIVRFTDVSYLRYDIVGGRICNPHWELWEHPADDWGCEFPWSCLVYNNEEFWIWIGQ